MWTIDPLPMTDRFPFRRWAVAWCGWGRPTPRFCQALRIASDLE